MKKQAFNPYLPGCEYIPDGEPRVFDGRVYIYGSHDRANGESFCLNDYVTWSAPVDDLGDWRYEGVIFRKDQDPENPELHALFAPDVVRGPDGRYYLYYSPVGTEVIGVAVCDTPCGPFEFVGHIAFPGGGLLGRGEEDPMPFDPGVLVDDDGRVYLYFGSDPTGFMSKEAILSRKIGPYVAELERDMHTIKAGPEPVVIANIAAPEPGTKGHGFFEASSMRKVNGRYCYIYSSLNSHELCYALGSSPMGPFEYGGVLHSNGDIGYQGRKTADKLNYTGNNHGSLCEIGGKWYVFGHRMTNHSVYSRQPIAQEVTVLEDGSIPQVEMTSCGLNGGPLNGLGTYEARIACCLYAKEGAKHVENDGLQEVKHLHPAFLQDEPDFDDFAAADRPRQYIGNLREGSVAGFKYFALGQAKTVSVTTRGDGGTLEVYTDLTGSPAAVIPVTAGEDWHESQTAELRADEGVQALWFVARTEGKIDFVSFTLA